MPRRPATILCLASYFKGHDFIRECHRLGARVLFVTREALRDLDWPRDSIDELLLMPDLTNRDNMSNGVSWLARTESIDRIVPLDEFDLEMASTLREHMLTSVPFVGSRSEPRLAGHIRTEALLAWVLEHVPEEVTAAAA